MQGQHLLEEPLAALMSSSARHSAMVLMLRNEASRAPVVRRYRAWFTRLMGDTSTACLHTTYSHYLAADGKHIIHMNSGAVA